MQKSVKKNIIFFFILLSASISWGNNMPTTLAKADSLFQVKKYSLAIKAYETLLKQKQASPAMLLKMAYIYEANNDYTLAQYCLTQYTQLTHDLSALDKQLSIAKKYALKGYENPEEKQIWYAVLPYSQYVMLVLLFFASLLVFIQFWLIKKNKKQFLFPVLTLLFLLVAAGVHNLFSTPKLGIVSAEKTFAMSGPSAAADISQIIRKGSRFEILEYTDVWAKVKMENEVYFVRQDAFIAINN